MNWGEPQRAPLVIGDGSSGVSVCLRSKASVVCPKMASEVVRDGGSFQLESFVRDHHVSVKYCL